MEGLNGPFPGFGRGIPLEHMTLYAFAVLAFIGPECVSLAGTKKCRGAYAHGFQELFSRHQPTHF
jgi:hypothetical protein